MKTRVLIALVLFNLSRAVSQETESTDTGLQKSLIGDWKHVTSTYPGGLVSNYEREITFKSDGTGICTKYFDKDTLTISFGWEVRDSVVYLFVVDKRGTRMEADAQAVSFLNPSKLYLSDVWGGDQTGTVCCYHRSQQGAGARF